MTLELVNLLPFGVIFSFLSVLRQLHIPPMHSSYNIIVARGSFFSIDNVILKDICKGIYIFVFFVVPVQTLQSEILWSCFDLEQGIVVQRNLREFVVENDFLFVLVEYGSNIDRNQTLPQTDIAFIGGQASIQLCEAHFLLLRFLDKFLNLAQQVGHKIIMRMQIDFRHTVFGIQYPRSDQRTAENRNFLSCTSQSKIRLQFRTQQSNDDFAPAIYRICCRMIFIYCLIYNNRGLEIRFFTDGRQKIGQSCFTDDLLFFSLINIGSCSLFGMSIVADIVVNDFPEVFINHFILIKQNFIGNGKVFQCLDSLILSNRKINRNKFMRDNKDAV